MALKKRVFSGNI